VGWLLLAARVSYFIAKASAEANKTDLNPQPNECAGPQNMGCGWVCCGRSVSVPAGLAAANTEVAAMTKEGGTQKA
jgi:hypothetical protein